MRSVIKQVSMRRDKEWSSVLQREIQAHLFACKERTRSFVGRENDLAAIERYVKARGRRPLVVFGTAGSGLTSLIAKATTEAKKWIRNGFHSVVRLIGETEASQSTLGLVRSLCTQLRSLSRGEDPPSRNLPTDWNALRNDFRDSLDAIAVNQTIVVFVDSLHELLAPSDEHKISWIPATLPPNVRFVVSTAGESPCNCLKLLRNWIPDEDLAGDVFLELGEFQSTDTARLLDSWFGGRTNRTLTPQQRLSIESCLDHSLSPLYVCLVLHEASQWRSFSNPDEFRVSTTVKSVVLELLGRLERSHSEALLRRTLGYLALARKGLTTPELEDLISLDDFVMDELHTFYRSPLRRIPPLLLLRLLSDVKILIRQSYSDRHHLTKLSHQLFRDVVEERYAKDPKTRSSYHRVMAEYFTSGYDKWNAGTASARAVTRQPLFWYSSDSNGAAMSGKIYNSRRLDELPYHLTFSRQVEKLKEFCFCNAEYLSARIEQSAIGLQILLSDLELAIRVESDDGDLQLLLGALRAALPILERKPRELVPQLTGRLQQILAADKPVTEKDSDRYPHLKRMLNLARTSATSHTNTLMPSATCLLPPSAATYQRLEGHLGPVTALATSSDGRFAAIAHKHNAMKVWDLTTALTVRTFNGVGSRLYGLCFAQQDQLVVSSERRLLRIWNIRTSECVGTLVGSDDPAVMSVASGGALLAAISQYSNHLRVWDLEASPVRLIREATLVESQKPVHKDSTTLLARTSCGSTILYGLRDTNTATAYDLVKGSEVRRMRLHEENASLTAVSISRTYFICGVRYPESRLSDRVCLDLFDSDSGQYLRSVKCCGHDVVNDIHVNAIGSHALVFGYDRTTDTSDIASWNIETQQHKHIARQGGGPCHGALGDLRYVLTATGDETHVRMWDLKSSVDAKGPREKPTFGLSRILTMRDYPQYVVSLGSDGRKVEVWNIAMNDLCGRVVYSNPTFTQPGDTVLSFNSVLVILTNRVYAKIDEEEESGDVLMYDTIKSFDLALGEWKSETDGCAIPVFPFEDYALLTKDQLLGLADDRSHFVTWDVASGTVLYRMRIPFRDKESTEDLEAPWNGEGLLMDTGRTASSAKMTPWNRRRETMTAKRRRHRAEFEDRRRCHLELHSEKRNPVDRFVVSADQRTVIASFFGHHICVFDLECRTQTHVLRSPVSMMHLFAFGLDQDGRFLANASYDEKTREATVTLWDLESGVETGRLVHSSWVNAVAVSTHASRIVFCSQSSSPSASNRLVIWEPLMHGSREIDGYHRFNLGADAEIRLSHNAQRAVVWSGDISVWDLDLGVLLCTFTPDAKIKCLEMALNGQLVTFGLYDTPSIVTLKMVSDEPTDAIKFTADDVRLFGESQNNVEEETEETNVDHVETKIRINPALFFQAPADI